MFYPLVLFGLIIANSSKLKFGALELFDSAIISLGSASVLAALLLNPLLELVKFDDFRIFLSIFYICADIVLLIFT
ncbi:MAG: GGDEF domain-containing protein, partial [Candidatus Fonsibacter sp.]